MKVIICQILIHFLDNVSTIHQSFKFLRNTGTRIVNKRTNYRIIACVFPKVIRLSIRISHQLLHIAHHIPWTVNINTSEMIAIVPFLHHLCLTFYASIRKNLIHFALYKTKTLRREDIIVSDTKLFVPVKILSFAILRQPVTTANLSA